METALLIFFATLSTSFAIAYLAILDKLKKSNLALIETFIAKEAIQDALLKTKDPVDFSDETMHKENFIKFLSDSRDWAFDYIETSQKIIKEVSEELNSKGLNNYSKKLITLLPEEGFKKN
jgi:4-hydroxy-L-threonine phosphate dehydrogenase PdxA